MPGERRFDLAARCVVHDVGGDERVAVAVAADPRAHRDRAGRVDSAAIRDRSDARGEVLCQRRDHVEQARVVVPDRFVDLVTDAQLRQTKQRRLPQQQHAHRQLVLDAGDSIGVIATQVEFVEKVRQLVENFEDRLAPYLGRVRGDHRAHLQRLHGGDQLVGADAGVADPIQYGVETPGLWGSVVPTVVPPATFEVDVLRGVREQRQPVQGTQHEELPVERMLGQRGPDVVDVAAFAPSGVDRDLTNLFDQLEDCGPVGLLDRVAQEASEQTDVVVDRLIVFVGGDGGDVGQAGDVGHRHSQAEPLHGGNPNCGWSRAPD